MEAKKNIHIGTSGWGYKHWKNIYYPEGMKPSEYLKYLSQSFNCTEINNSFYHLPDEETVKTWTASVPKNFKFCPKMSRYLTQMKKLNDPEEPLERFFSIFAPMKKMMGPILLQLPPQLGFHLEKTENFFKILKNNYSTYQFAMETRHVSWLDPEVMKLFTRYKISFVIADSGGRFPQGEFVPAKDIYIRFHGPDGSYGTSYDLKTMKRYADKFSAWAKNGHRLWIFFNNDIHGYAIENANTLKKLLHI